MKKIIVTTTIYPPSKALLKYIDMKDWEVIVVGDLKTPHHLYENLDVIYLSPEYQEKHYENLSWAIGWNCIMRRNIGFIEAYRMGADIVASIDDDNIPLERWGKDIFIGSDIPVRMYAVDDIAFDPLSVTNYPYLWHRGYPIDDIATSRETRIIGDVKQPILIQVGLWDGDPDIDAMCRYVYNPKNLRMDSPYLYSSHKYIPFNSQNTFLHREVLPYYMMLPHVGRVDDIWGGYILQSLLNIRPVFTFATTYQDRNAQSIEKNFRDEIYGYTNTKNFLIDINNTENWKKYLPMRTLFAWKLYRECYN